MFSVFPVMLTVIFAYRFLAFDLQSTSTHISSQVLPPFLLQQLLCI